MNNAKFKLYRARDSHFYYRLYTDDFFIIMDGEADRAAYAFKEDCRKAIDEIRRNAADDKCYLREEAMMDEYYFVFVDENGEILAISEFYETEMLRDSAILFFKAIVPDASVEDITEPSVSNVVH